MPGLDEVLAAAHVVRVPLRVRFRGIEAREAVLLDGPAGWGEFAPFTEYADPEASRWLAAGLEAAWGVAEAGWPAPVNWVPPTFSVSWITRMSPTFSIRPPPSSR